MSTDGRLSGRPSGLSRLSDVGRDPPTPPTCRHKDGRGVATVPHKLPVHPSALAQRQVVEGLIEPRRLEDGGPEVLPKRLVGNLHPTRASKPSVTDQAWERACAAG